MEVDRPPAEQPVFDTAAGEELVRLSKGRKLTPMGWQDLAGAHDPRLMAARVADTAQCSANLPDRERRSGDLICSNRSTAMSMISSLNSATSPHDAASVGADVPADRLASFGDGFRGDSLHLSRCPLQGSHYLPWR
jgi:hypothetical protein